MRIRTSKITWSSEFQDGRFNGRALSDVARNNPGFLKTIEHRHKATKPEHQFLIDKIKEYKKKQLNLFDEIEAEIEPKNS
jgi:hypothetical protein